MDESPVTQKQLRDAISESETRLLDAISSTEKRMQEALSSTNEALEMRLLERIEKSETALLTEFRKWAMPVSSRLKLNETWQVSFTASVTERLAFIEERLATLEHK
jgi:hypothetical protein